MENNKDLIQENNENEKLVQNNNILVDLLIKFSKLTTINTMLLDYVNFYKYNDNVLLSPELYNDITNDIVKVINKLNNLYNDLMKNKDNEVQDNNE